MMKEIPENRRDIEKLLYKQVALLIEKSSDEPVEIRKNIKLLLKLLGY